MEKTGKVFFFVCDCTLTGILSRVQLIQQFFQKFGNYRKKNVEISEKESLITGLMSYRIKIFNSGHNSHGHFSPVSGSFRARVQGGAESFADLLHTRLQLVTLEEDDEDRLVHLVRLQENSFVFIYSLEL